MMLNVDASERFLMADQSVGPVSRAEVRLTSTSHCCDHISVRSHAPGQTGSRSPVRRFSGVRTLHFPRYLHTTGWYGGRLIKTFPGVLITQVIFGSNTWILSRNQKRKLRVKRPKNGRPALNVDGQAWDGIQEDKDVVYFDEDKMYEYVDPKVDAEYFENLGRVKELEKVDYAAYYDYSDFGILDFTRPS